MVHIAVHGGLVAKLVGQFHLVERKTVLREFHFLMVDIVESVKWRDTDLRFTNIRHTFKIHGIFIQNKVNLPRSIAFKFMAKRRKHRLQEA